MSKCIFHIGMPKTGTSSIQESLFHGLDDPRFHYMNFGEMNANRALATLFKGNPKDYYYHRQIGISEVELQRYRGWAMRRLERSLEDASSNGQSILFSAENGWTMKRDELLAFRTFMESKGFTVKVIAYLRPFKAYLESMFQQNVKMGTVTALFHPASLHALDYRDRIETLEDVFGRNRMEIHIYQPEYFPERCAVRHFCDRLGIEFDPDRIRRSNESIFLPATKLLYTLRKLGPGFGVGRMALLKDWILRKRMMELKGPPVRFGKSMIEPLRYLLEEQAAWIGERFGNSILIDFQDADERISINDESDLHRYDRETLEWLSEASGGKVSNDPEQVATQMHKLRSNPGVGSMSHFAGMFMKEKLERMLPGGMAIRRT